MIVVGILAPSSEVEAGRGSSAVGVSVVAVAARAAAAGARTEIVGVAPAGDGGDRQLVELATAGIGHATVTRSSAAGIEAADLDLALRYLPDVRVIALVAPSTPLLATALGASSWSGAALIVVGPLDADGTAAIAAVPPGPGTPIVLDPPDEDPDAAFAGVIAALAVRLDAGEDPAGAWRSTVTALAIDPA